MTIAGNPISYIEDHAFAGLQQLHTLQIIDCNLTSMPPVADVKDTIIDLYLAPNRIAFVPYGYFRGFKKLHRLSLGENLLTEVPDVTDLASTLNDLGVQCNSIVHFPNWMLPITTAKLEQLEIYDNEIQVFPPMILCHQPRLRYIDLADNNLTTLSWYHDVTQGSKAKVNIAGNPLHCNYSLAWLSRDNHTRNDDVFTDTIQYIGGQCGSPQQVRGRSLDEIGMYYFVQRDGNRVHTCL